MMATITITDLAGGLFLLIFLTFGTFVWTWLLRDRDEMRVPAEGLIAGDDRQVTEDVYIDGRIIAHRGEWVKLASRVFYRDLGYCWSATANGRHIFPIPESALSVDSVQG